LVTDTDQPVIDQYRHKDDTEEQAGYKGEPV